MRAPTRCLLACALVLTAAAPASAGDLTGTWKGKWSCKSVNASGKLKLTSTSVTAPEPGVSTLEISHPDGPGTAAIQAYVDGALFAGFSLQPDPEITSGVGAFIGCDPGDVRSFKWKVKIGEIPARITWRSMHVSDDQTISSCRGSWKRISVADPGISDTCR